MATEDLDLGLEGLFDEIITFDSVLNINSKSTYDDLLDLQTRFNGGIPELYLREIDESNTEIASSVNDEKHPEKQNLLTIKTNTDIMTELHCDKADKNDVWQNFTKSKFGPQLQTVGSVQQDNILLSEREEEVITSDSIECKEPPPQQQLPILQHNGSPQLSNELQQLPTVQCNEPPHLTNTHCNELAKLPNYGAVRLHDKTGKRHKAVNLSDRKRKHGPKGENSMLVETCYEAVETDVKQVKKTSNAIEPYVNHPPVAVSKCKASVLPPQNIYSNNTEKDHLLPSISDQIENLMIQDSVEQHQQSILQKDVIAEEVSAQEVLSQIIQPVISPEVQSQNEEVSSVNDNPEDVAYVVLEDGVNANEMQYQIVTTEGIDQQQSQQQIVYLIQGTNKQLVNEETVPQDGTVDQALTYETLIVDGNSTETVSDNVLTYWMDDNGQLIEPTDNSTNKQLQQLPTVQCNQPPQLTYWIDDNGQLQMSINANQNQIVSETFPQTEYNEIKVESNDPNSYKQTDNSVASSTNNYECHGSAETMQKIKLHNNIDKEPHSEALEIDFPELGNDGILIGNPCVPFSVEEAAFKTEVSEQNGDDLNSQCDDIVEEKAIPYDVAYFGIPATVEQMACQPEDDSSTKGKKKAKARTKSNGKPVRSIQKPLWEFLLDVLANPNHNPSVITWLEKNKGSFKIVNGVDLANLWTKARHREADLKYEFFARTLRHYYVKGILKRMPGKKLQYLFCEEHDWRTYDKNTAMKKAKQLC